MTALRMTALRMTARPHKAAAAHKPARPCHTVRFVDWQYASLPLRQIMGLAQLMRGRR